MRIWLDPEKMRVRGLTPDDVMEAVESQNMAVSAGSVGAPPTPSDGQFEFTLTAQGRLTTPEEFGSIVIKTTPEGEMLHLSDVPHRAWQPELRRVGSRVG